MQRGNPETWELTQTDKARFEDLFKRVGGDMQGGFVTGILINL